MIYLIGLGSFFNGEWNYESFVVDHLTRDEETRIVNNWIKKMNEIKNETLCRGNPRIWHWSNAEITMYKKATNNENPAILNWIDAQNILVEEKVVIKNVFDYKLKNIVKGMYDNNLIDINYNNLNITSGMDALVDGYNMALASARNNINFSDYLKTKDIIKYNHIDCLSIYKVITYFRTMS